jgi:creatinine amidohydrolase
MNHELANLTWPEAKKRFDAGAVALLPIGATEAHGPHLPLHTDVYLSLELAHRLADEINAVILPPIVYTVTNFAAEFPGTITLSPTTAAAVLNDIIESLGTHGIKTIALINSHLEPAHIDILQKTAEANQSGPRVLFANHCRKPWALELSDEFKSGDCHAGSYETSLMLAGRYANSVRTDEMKSLPPVHAGLVQKMKDGMTTFNQMGADNAYFGQPANATADEGEQLWRILVKMWRTTIESPIP